MAEYIVGACSICGGDVVVPAVYHGIHQPIPSCRQCGATKKDDRKVIQMEHRQKVGGHDL